MIFTIHGLEQELEKSYSIPASYVTLNRVINDYKKVNPDWFVKIKLGSKTVYLSPLTVNQVKNLYLQEKENNRFYRRRLQR